MEPVSSYQEGTAVLVQYLPWQSPPLKPPVTLFDRPRYSEQVGSTGIARGNRHSPNNWTYSVYKRMYPLGTALQNGSEGSWSRYEGYLCLYKTSNDPVVSKLSFPSYLYNETLSKLNEKVRGSIDLSIDIAQIGQTASMFKATDKVIAVAKMASIKGAIKGVSSFWLEYRYGWSPLLSTIYDSASAIIHKVNKDLCVVRVRSSERMEGFKASYDLISGTCPGVVDLDGAYRCEFKMRFRPKSNSLATWSSLNPASIAWELMPYSFVVDWFVNVGDYIRDLETSLLYSNNFVDGYYTESVYLQGSWRSTSQVVTATGSTTYKSTNRVVMSKYPVPRLPSFKCDLGSGRLLNAAALLGVLLK